MTEEIRKLSDYQHARLRTPVYFGSNQKHTQLVLSYLDNKPILKEMTWVPALYTAFREILDNSLDEVIKAKSVGFVANRIDITFDESNMQFSVSDNGRGIPIDWDEQEKCHKATLALSHSRAGRNFIEERGEVGGQNGMGAACTNFCSEWFRLEIYRDNKRFRQEFHEGNAVNDELQVGTPKIIDITSGRTGTTVEFKLSKVVFKEMVLPEEFIKSRIYEVALANPEIKIYYNDEQIKIKNYEKSLFTSKPIEINIEVPGFKSVWHMMPNFQEEYYHSLVNNIPTFDGGTHVDAFRRGFFGGLLAALEKESKRRKLYPNRSDVTQGLLIYNVTKMNSPSFNSQSKTRLINEDCAKVISKYFTEQDVYTNIIRKNKEWIESIYERCRLRTNARDDSDADKEAKKNLRKKTPNLTDCSSIFRKECYLFITEGSGVKGLIGARNAKIHAGLGLKGKITNSHGLSSKELLKSDTLAELMSTIGLIPNSKAENIRYGKICITTDADEDGKNINALIVNFFYNWPELFNPEDPKIYVFNTPFIIAKKGKERLYWFAYNYHEFKPEEWKGYEITRAKGIGSLETPDWKILLSEIDKHLLPLKDDGQLKNTLDLIFNKSRADDRKEWLSNE